MWRRPVASRSLGEVAELQGSVADGRWRAARQCMPGVDSVVDEDWSLAAEVEILAAGLEVDPRIAASHQEYQRQCLEDDLPVVGPEAVVAFPGSRFGDEVGVEAEAEP